MNRSPGQGSRWRVAAARLLLLAVSVLLSLVLAEGLLRLIGLETGGADYRGITIRDPEMGHRFKPDTTLTVVGGMRDYETLVRTNALGFRGRQPAKQPAEGTLRILLLGDSDVFGQGVQEDSMLDRRLEEALGASPGPRYEVVNLALPGVGTLAETKIMERYGAALAPDLVVLLVTVANDLQDNVEFRHRERSSKTPPPSVTPAANPGAESAGIVRFLKSTYLYRFAKPTVRRIVVKVPMARKALLALASPGSEDQPHLVRQWYLGDWVEEGWPLMTEGLLSIREQAARVGSEFLVVVIPSLPQYDEANRRTMLDMVSESVRADLAADPDRPQRMIREFCETHGIRYVEALSEFRRLARKDERLRHPNDGHLNAAGTDALARVLAEAIRP